jgi:hypothetical protein
MPRISSFFGIVIYMYFKDHNPPHFHAMYGEHTAEIAIKDFALIEGNLPPRAMALVIEWAAQHQIELLENWTAMSQGDSWKTIAPLV